MSQDCGSLFAASGRMNAWVILIKTFPNAYSRNEYFYLDVNLVEVCLSKVRAYSVFMTYVTMWVIILSTLVFLTFGLRHFTCFKWISLNGFWKYVDNYLMCSIVRHLPNIIGQFAKTSSSARRSWYEGLIICVNMYWLKKKRKQPNAIFRIG